MCQSKIILCKIFVYLGLLDTFLVYMYKEKKHSLRLQRPVIFFSFTGKTFYQDMCLFYQSTLVWGSVCPFILKFQVLTQFRQDLVHYCPLHLFF